MLGFFVISRPNLLVTVGSRTSPGHAEGRLFQDNVYRRGSGSPEQQAQVKEGQGRTTLYWGHNKNHR